MKKFFGDAVPRQNLQVRIYATKERFHQEIYRCAETAWLLVTDQVPDL